MTTCAHCSRRLTHEVSCARGWGPECDPDPEARRAVARSLRPERPPKTVRPRHKRSWYAPDGAAQLGLFERLLLAEALHGPASDVARGPDGDCVECGGLPWGDCGVCGGCVGGASFW